MVLLDFTSRKTENVSSAKKVSWKSVKWKICWVIYRYHIILLQILVIKKLHQIELNTVNVIKEKTIMLGVQHKYD